ncbi:hypothetical protein D3C71_1852480 [compost metagenome]
MHGVNRACAGVAQHAHGVDNRVDALQAGQPGGYVGVVRKIHGHLQGACAPVRRGHTPVYGVPRTGECGRHGVADEAGGARQQNMHLRSLVKK